MSHHGNNLGKHFIQRVSILISVKTCDNYVRRLVTYHEHVTNHRSHDYTYEYQSFQG